MLALVHDQQQPLPNAFEIFGFDFLLSAPVNPSESIQPVLLEVNSGPDFAQTGDALHGVIDRLFANVLTLAVRGREGAQEVPDGMLQCLDVNVRSW